MILSIFFLLIYNLLNFLTPVKIFRSLLSIFDFLFLISDRLDNCQEQLQQQQQQQQQQQPVARYLPFFKAANVGADTSMPSTEQPQQPSYFFSSTAAATSTATAAATTTTPFFTSSTSATSSSLFPPSSSSSSSDFTAAWVASTPFSAALCDGGANEGGANDPTLHFLAPVVSTTSGDVTPPTTRTISTMGVSQP